MYEAILFQFPNCCSLFYEKNCRAWTQQIFSLNDYEATREARSLEAHTKGGPIGEKLMLWPLIGRIMWTKIVRWLDVSFFTCGKHRSLLWLAKTHLRIKIYDIAFQWESKYTLFACREVRIGENSTRVLDYWGHSFSYTDRPSRQMTYLFFPTNKIFMNILLQPTQFMLCTCVDMARDQMQNQN